MPRILANAPDLVISPDGAWLARLDQEQLRLYPLDRTTSADPLPAPATSATLPPWAMAAQIGFLSPELLLLLWPYQEGGAALPGTTAVPPGSAKAGLCASLLSVPDLRALGSTVLVAGATRILGIGPAGAVVAPQAAGADVIGWRGAQLTVEGSLFRGDVLAAVPAPERRWLIEQRAGYEVWDPGVRRTVARVTLSTRQPPSALGYVQDGRMMWSVCGSAPSFVSLFRTSDGRPLYESEQPGRCLRAEAGLRRLVLLMDTNEGHSLLDLDVATYELRHLPLALPRVLSYAVRPAGALAEVLAVLDDPQAPGADMAALPVVRVPLAALPGLREPEVPRPGTAPRSVLPPRSRTAAARPSASGLVVPERGRAPGSTPAEAAAPPEAAPARPAPRSFGAAFGRPADREGRSGPAVVDRAGRSVAAVADREGRSGPAVVDREGRSGPAVVDREGRSGPAVVDRPARPPAAGEPAADASPPETEAPPEAPAAPRGPSTSFADRFRRTPTMAPRPPEARGGTEPGARPSLAEERAEAGARPSVAEERAEARPVRPPGPPPAGELPRRPAPRVEVAAPLFPSVPAVAYSGPQSFAFEALRWATNQGGGGVLAPWSSRPGDPVEPLLARLALPATAAPLLVLLYARQRLWCSDPRGVPLAELTRALGPGALEAAAPFLDDTPLGQLGLLREGPAGLRACAELLDHLAQRPCPGLVLPPTETEESRAEPWSLASGCWQAPAGLGAATLSQVSGLPLVAFDGLLHPRPLPALRRALRRAALAGAGLYAEGLPGLGLPATEAELLALHRCLREPALVVLLREGDLAPLGLQATPLPTATLDLPALARAQLPSAPLPSGAAWQPPEGEEPQPPLSAPGRAALQDLPGDWQGLAQITLRGDASAAALWRAAYLAARDQAVLVCTQPPSAEQSAALLGALASLPLRLLFTNRDGATAPSADAPLISEESPLRAYLT